MYAHGSGGRYLNLANLCGRPGRAGAWRGTTAKIIPCIFRIMLGWRPIVLRRGLTRGLKEDSAEFEAVRVRLSFGTTSLFVFDAVRGGPVLCDGVAARAAASGYCGRHADGFTDGYSSRRLMAVNCGNAHDYLRRP